MIINELFGWPLMCVPTPVFWSFVLGLHTIWKGGRASHGVVIYILPKLFYTYLELNNGEGVQPISCFIIFWLNMVVWWRTGWVWITMVLCNQVGFHLVWLHLTFNALERSNPNRWALIFTFCISPDLWNRFLPDLVWRWAYLGWTANKIVHRNGWNYFYLGWAYLMICSLSSIIYSPVSQQFIFFTSSPKPLARFSSELDRIYIWWICIKRVH